MTLMTPLPGNALTQARRAEIVYATWDVEIDQSIIQMEWLFQPQFWIHVAGHLRKGDLIRIHARDGSYDFMAVVTGRTTGGKLAARIKMWPTIPDELLVAAASAAAGTLVAKTVNGKQVPRVEHVEVDGWRLIGLDNTVHSRGHESKAHAEAAMAQYLNVYGIKAVAPPPPSVDTREPADKLPPDLNVSYAKRKEAEDKAKRDAQRKADLEQLEKRRLDNAAKANV